MSEPSQSNQPAPIDQATYWNENGGQKWVANIDHIDTMIGVFNAHVLCAAGASTGERVLDVGCGGGTTSRALAEAVTSQGEVLGVDVSEVILQAAIERRGDAKNLRFELGDAANFKFEPNYFDLMTSRFGIMFFEEPARAFENLRMALKPNGRVAFVCWRALAQNPWMAAPAAAAFEVLPQPEPQDPNAPGPFAFADQTKLKALLQTVGFTGVSVEPVDELLVLGTISEALQFLSRMGPAAAALQEASDDKRQAALEAVEQVLNGYVTDGLVRIPGGVWLVRAAAGKDAR